MRVVVVGATGNVGTSVVEALVEDSAVSSVLGLSRRRPDWQPDKTSWVVADVTVDDLVPHFQGADAVVHLAWVLQPTHDPSVTWRNNVFGSLRVFQATAAAGVRTLVYCSSVCAYSPGGRAQFVTESWPTHGWPAANYTREKSYVERVLDSFELERRDVRVVRFRPGLMLKRESAAEQRRILVGQRLSPRLARPGLIRLLPHLPDLRFQVLHSRDAARAFRLAVVGKTRGAFNLAADPIIDSPQLAALLGAKTIRIPPAAMRAALAAGWHLRVLTAPSPHLFDAVLTLPLMDVTRARTELGWWPRWTSLEAVRELLDGLRANAGMDTPPLAIRTPRNRVFR